MGIPYSKQINLAFDQVTPLVAAGFKVLETTRNITFLLAAIQVLTAIFLGLILITLLALIITVSPDLEDERKLLVTPAVKYIAESTVQYGGWLKIGLWIVIVGALVGSLGGWLVTREIGESPEFEVVGGDEGEEKLGDGAES